MPGPGGWQTVCAFEPYSYAAFAKAQLSSLFVVIFPAKYSETLLSLLFKPQSSQFILDHERRTGKLLLAHSSTDQERMEEGDWIRERSSRSAVSNCSNARQDAYQEHNSSWIQVIWSQNHHLGLRLPVQRNHRYTFFDCREVETGATA